MPPDQVFTAGHIAKKYLSIAQWYGERGQSVGAKTYCMPFMGMGRILSGVCDVDTECYGNDFQRVSGCVIDGIFRAEKFLTNVDKPRFRKGAVVAGEWLDVDIHSAGFIDWVVQNGTPLDVACLGMAIPGQTMRGWLSKWTGNFQSLWTKFTKIREECREFIPRPGEWYFWEDDFFEVVDQMADNEYDVLILELPQLVGNRDLYSGGWAKLNQVLGGDASIRPWTHKNYFLNLRRTLGIKSKYILLTWTDCDLPTSQLIEFMEGFGTIESSSVWPQTNGKNITGWQLRR